MNSFDKRKSLMAKVATGSMVTFAGIIAGRGIFFGIQVLISRLYGPEYFGQMVIGLTAIEMIRILSSIGLPKGGMRFVSLSIGSKKFEKLYEIIGTAIFFPVIINIVVCMSFFLLAEYIAIEWFNDPRLVFIFKSLIVCGPFIIVSGVCIDLSKGFNTTIYSVLTEYIIVPLSRILLFIFFLLLGHGFNSIIYSIILSSAIGASVILYFLRNQISEKVGMDFDVGKFFNKWFFSKDKQKIIAYSLPLFFTGVLGMVMRSVDVLMLGHFLYTKSVGIYAAAYSIAALISFLLINSLNSIFAPMIATQYGNKQIDNIKYLYIATTRWMFYIALPIFAGLMAAREYIMGIYGYAFVEKGEKVLAILIIGQMANCLTGAVGNILSMTGHQGKELLTNVIVVIINITLNLLLIPAFGIIGAAVATSVSLIIVNGIRVAIVYYIYRVQPLTLKLMILSMITVAVVGGYCLLQTVLPNFRHDLLWSVISVFLIVFAVFVFGFLKEDRELRKLVLGKPKEYPTRAPSNPIHSSIQKNKQI
jgi:O-antigen/teichoic acid export membrane protein